jgi:hypothetical protein
LRIEADFVFGRKCVITVAGQEWVYQPGERFQLFFSYRHTPDRTADLFASVGVSVRHQWINQSNDEGVFLCGLNPK